MKSMPLIALVLFVTACVDTDATPPPDHRDVVLFVAPGDVDGTAWTLNPVDYQIDQPLHVTGTIPAEGARARDLGALIAPGDVLMIDGTNLVGVVGWYAP